MAIWQCGVDHAGHDDVAAGIDDVSARNPWRLAGAERDDRIPIDVDPAAVDDAHRIVDRQETAFLMTIAVIRAHLPEQECSIALAGEQAVQAFRRLERVAQRSIRQSPGRRASRIDTDRHGRDRSANPAAPVCRPPTNPATREPVGPCRRG